LVVFEGVEGVAKDVTKGVASGYTLRIFPIILRERKILIVKIVWEIAYIVGNYHNNQKFNPKKSFTKYN